MIALRVTGSPADTGRTDPSTNNRVPSAGSLRAFSSVIDAGPTQERAPAQNLEAAPEHDAIEHGSRRARSPNRSPVRPLWLRPLLLAGIGGAYVIPFLTVAVPTEAPPATTAIAVDMVAQGEAVPERQERSEPAPDEPVAAAPPPAEAPTVTSADTPQAVTAKEARIENPDAIVVAAEVEKVVMDPPPKAEAAPSPEKPIAPPKPKDTPVPPKPVEPDRKPTVPKPVARKKSVPHKASKETDAKVGDRNTTVGLRTGTGSETGLTPAAFQAIVNRQIALHMYSPPGVAPQYVSVSYSIGASGAVTAVSATGDPALVEIAKRVIRSIRVPPPPGGSFHGASRLHFHL